jgi:hypothetical protein
MTIISFIISSLIIATPTSAMQNVGEMPGDDTKISYSTFGGYPTTADPNNGTVCNEIHEIAFSSMGASRRIYCADSSTSTPNLVTHLSNISISPKIFSLIIPQAFLLMSSLENLPQKNETTVSDDWSFILSIRSNGKTSSVTTFRHNPGIGPILGSLIDTIESFSAENLTARDLLHRKVKT